VGKWESLGDFTGILKNRQITKKNCGFSRWVGVLFLPCNGAVATEILLLGQREKSVRPKRKMSLAEGDGVAF